MEKYIYMAGITPAARPKKLTATPKVADPPKTASAIKAWIQATVHELTVKQTDHTWGPELRSGWYANSLTKDALKLFQEYKVRTNYKNKTTQG